MQNTSFNHSVKVPKLYKCAAKISQEVAEGGGSVKQLVYEKKHFNTKALYALVATTFQKAKEINLLLKRTKLLEKEPRLDPWLAKILISEVLWGKKQLPNSDAKPIQTILAYEQVFHAHLSDSSGDTTAVNQAKLKKPRYVRINTLINPLNEALELFQDEGWTLQTNKIPNDYKSFLEQVTHLEGYFMLKDLHIPDLLIFPGGTEFYNHPGYKKGALVLQDKASCLPVHLLSPSPGSVVLDMCAAPGMKTTQLATVLQNEGTIYAVENDPKRFEVLNKMVEISGATCIKTFNKDVLQCGNSDFPDVEYILVDPSCSSSGMTDRLELHQTPDHLRLQKLAGFQIKILRSALTRYPKVKKIVYSTCSLYPEENEDVVRQVLETNNNFKLVPADKLINKAWKNFGSPDFGDIGKFCLYAKPEDDLTNGFFVAVFERLQEGENNQFFNGRVLNYRKNVEQKQARKERKYKEQMERGDNFKADGEENYHEKGLNKKESDVDVNDIIHEDENHNSGDSLIKSKKKKRNATDVDVLEKEVDHENTGEEKRKRKKRKQEYYEVENGTETGDNNHGLNYNNVTEGNNISEPMSESLKKDKKKKKQKDNEDKTVMHTDDKNYELSHDTIREGEDENTNNSSNGKKKRRHKEINVDVDTLEKGVDNENTQESPKKQKKKKKEHNEVEDVTRTDDNNQGLTYNDIAEGNKNILEVMSESLKKNEKKKKRKDYKDKTVMQTDDKNYELAHDIGEGKDENTNGKKKRRHKEISENDKLSINVDNFDQSATDNNVEISKKSKKKKNKHVEVDNLNKPNGDTRNVIDDDDEQNTKRTYKILVDETTDESLKKSKKKKRKDKELDQDVVNTLINKSLKNSKKEKERHIYVEKKNRKDSAVGSTT